MALDSYANLQAEVLKWTRRTDIAAEVPTFITLAEAQMNRRLRVRRMTTRSTAALSGEYSAVPDDFLGVRTLSVIGSPFNRLDYLAPDQFDGVAQSTGSGDIQYYTIVGSEFRYYPAPSASVTANLAYYAAIPALSDSNTSNWVLANHPDAYLYGALVQSAPYLRADDRLAVWGTLFTQAMTDIESADTNESQGATLTPMPSTAWAGYL